jgi:hypothetical protein
MSSNLFIVNTPFHLLTAFILQKARRGADNYLALIHPHGYERWGVNPVLKYMASTEGGYKDVFPLINFLSSRHKEKPYRKQVQEVREKIKSLGIDDVFLGSDIDPQNQLLAAALGKTSFYRYEDGLYSYYNENRRRSFSHEWFHKLKIKALEIAAGIPLKMYINTSTASDSRAGKGDFMYYPKLLQRYSPKAEEITKPMIDAAVLELREKNLLTAELINDSVLYLSQPLVEQGKITLEEEFAILKSVAKAAAGKCDFFYKPHPNDSAYKLEFYRKNLPEMQEYKSLKPAELAFASEKKLRLVLSYQSTALMTANKFSNGNVAAVSFALLYKGEKLHEAYVDIMKKAGVEFIQNEKAAAEAVLKRF